MEYAGNSSPSLMVSSSETTVLLLPIGTALPGALRTEGTSRCGGAIGRSWVASPPDRHATRVERGESMLLEFDELHPPDVLMMVPSVPSWSLARPSHRGGALPRRGALRPGRGALPGHRARPQHPPTPSAGAGARPALR